MAAVGALLVVYELSPPVSWGVVVVGAGATGLSWGGVRLPHRVGRVVLYLAGYVVAGGALWGGAWFGDLTLGGVAALNAFAAIHLCRAVEYASTPGR